METEVKGIDKTTEALEGLAEAMYELAKAVEPWAEEMQEAKRRAESMVACRICGRRYISKQEAKACTRIHEWQNRRGRR
jgi:uncharacterized protein YukE